GPGTYRLFELPQRGYVQTAPAGGAFVALAISGADVTTADFGNVRRDVFVTGADAGGTPTVQVYDADTGALRMSFDAYVSGFRGGVRVASGFFNNDTIPDVVTAAGPGGGPHVKVFDGATGGVILEFFAYAATFTGGVNLAVGDVNGDGLD